MVKYYVGGNSRIAAPNCQGKSMEPKKGASPAASILALLGFRMEESDHQSRQENTFPIAFPPIFLKEACEKINPKGGPGKTASLFEFPKTGPTL
jgi:hypothetical protein